MDELFTYFGMVMAGAVDSSKQTLEV